MSIHAFIDHKIAFLRHQGQDVCLGFLVVSAVAPVTEKEVLAALRRTLAEWVTTTETGRAVYGAFETLNFGDFLMNEIWKDAAFNALAQKNGISRVEGISVEIPPSNIYDYGVCLTKQASFV